ncbi:MAG: AarF/UbiB family protein [Nitrospinota bacterium]|nr:AarF/UbiB family protein [Nitrospinota bacterium]
MKNLIKRGVGLFKIGNALRNIRKSTDDETRERAQHYLMELLGKSRGLPTKVGQFMTMDDEKDSLREALSIATPPMSMEEFTGQLSLIYDKPYDSIFSSIEMKGKPASLGQVHKAVLRDGRQVAVKVQYPGIAHSVEAEMKLFGWMPKAGPVSKWGFNLEGYRAAFHENFLRELDYLCEAEQQARYQEMCRPLDDVVIPNVVKELTRHNVLVQEWREGMSLDEAEKLSDSQKLGLGRAILRHYFHMLFRHGYVHSDPNPANFAFCVNQGEGAVVVYDFGSILKINNTIRLGLIRTILAVSGREAVDPASCMASLGFDVDKLEDLRPTLPALLQVLFDPFTTEAPYHAKDWRISERFDGIVGDLKWWFRSAAPPELIFLMRTLHGMTSMLKRLDVALPWRFIFNQLCRDLFPQAQAFKLPSIPKVEGAASGFHEMSTLLKIHVVKTNGNVVDLSMPSRVVEDLEAIIDPPVMEAIRKNKIDLDGIQKRARKTGFIPQDLFEISDSERQVRVWLE